MTKQVGDRTLLVKTRSDGELRITIPADYKVTFGPLSQRGYEGGNALRIYESEKQQRACFVDVVSFRDLSIPVQKRTRKTRSKSESESDSKGNRKNSSETHVEDEGWVDA